MKNLILLTLVLFIGYSCKSDKKEFVPLNNNKTTVYYFIRHAEKDRSDLTNKDPELTKIGIERTKNWATLFKSIDFDLIFSTDYKRTLETALPTAIEKKLIIQIYDPTNLNDSLFKGKTKDKTVLIVGHSNTTPAFVNAILGEEKFSDIEDTVNDHLYIVTINNDTTLVTLEKHN